ncbi:hypothetical protein ABS71_17570 [bacterium SCN 62-11]|nr:hypothetical protein [Candidatus Eremiobacteraeota bacterium]ODT59992.1 MAG: hypothetical protein ABS71_17570 [bacterium SCN 62-11]
MGDIQSPRLLLFKALLFLTAGFMAGAALLLEHFSWTNLFLLLTVIFSFSRFYYFCFYVIEHYIDPTYKFAGLTSVITYYRSKR